MYWAREGKENRDTVKCLVHAASAGQLWIDQFQGFLIFCFLLRICSYFNCEVIYAHTPLKKIHLFCTLVG